MPARLFPLRLAAGAAACILLAVPALAQPSLGFKTGGKAKTVEVSTISFSISRVYDYDAESGQMITAVPPRVELGSMYVTRPMDANSGTFIAAIAKSTPLGDVSVTLQNGDVWTLKDATIGSYNTYSDDTQSGGQTENFELLFNSAEMTVGGQKLTLSPVQQ